jgi:hypothetical protein
MHDRHTHHGAPRRLSPRDQRERRQPWTRPLRRLRRAIDKSRQLIERSRQVVEESARSTAADRRGRAVRMSRDFHRASGWLVDAVQRLQRAAGDLGETNESMLLAVERAGRVPGLLMEATGRWVETARELALVSNQLEELHGLPFDSIENFIPVPGRTDDGRPRIIVTPRIIWARPFLLLRRSRMRDRVLSVYVRRRRTRPRLAADAPRSISRGRAPPFTSTVCVSRQQQS